MSEKRTGYFRRLALALMGRTVLEPAPPVTAVTEGDAGLRARVASLEMDLRERDERIESMKIEYATLQASKDRAVEGAGDEELEKLFKRLSGPLSNLATLKGLAEEGKEISSQDLLDLFGSVAKELARAGMEPIGAVGEETEFDTALHQRMSGGTVHDGAAVMVRVPGYRKGDKILLKAMVTTK